MTTDFDWNQAEQEFRAEQFLADCEARGVVLAEFTQLSDAVVREQWETRTGMFADLSDEEAGLNLAIFHLRRDGGSF